MLEFGKTGAGGPFLGPWRASGPRHGSGIPVSGNRWHEFGGRLTMMLIVSGGCEGEKSVGCFGVARHLGGILIMVK